MSTLQHLKYILLETKVTRAKTKLLSSLMISHLFLQLIATLPTAMSCLEKENQWTTATLMQLSIFAITIAPRTPGDLPTPWGFCILAVARGTGICWGSSRGAGICL